MTTPGFGINRSLCLKQPTPSQESRPFGYRASESSSTYAYSKKPLSRNHHRKRGKKVQKSKGQNDTTLNCPWMNSSVFNIVTLSSGIVDSVILCFVRSIFNIETWILRATHQERQGKAARGCG